MGATVAPVEGACKHTFGWSLDSERMFGHPGLMARTRVRRRRFALTVLILALTAFLVGPVSHALVAGAEVRRAPHRTYVVRPGDTIFSIASRQVTEGADPRPMVDAIEDANEIGPGRLIPGQALVIPAA
jgi:LysM domain-containing protein